MGTIKWFIWFVFPRFQSGLEATWYDEHKAAMSHDTGLDLQHRVRDW